MSEWVENSLYGCLIIAVLILVFVLAWFALSPKHVNSYYLAGDTNGNGGLYLCTDIENSSDLRIALNGVPLQEAVALVDSLNSHLPK